MNKRTCTNCILTDSYPGIRFDDKGMCNYCSNKKPFSPLDKDYLERAIHQARKANRQYDVLVPLSGGKDSTFMLYLAVYVYHLKVLAITFDNGFLSPIALGNIDRAVRITNAKHIFCRPNMEELKTIYRNTLSLSGDICGACGVGIRQSVIKTAIEYKTPLIFMGVSPVEDKSASPETIYDIPRFKTILHDSHEVSREMIRNYIPYPNELKVELMYSLLGIKSFSPLYYDVYTEEQISRLDKENLVWEEDNSSSISKHFDCMAEPLTNYIRNKRFGYERHICQLSNMIRSNEMTRQEALEKYKAYNIDDKPLGYETVFEFIKLDKKELDNISKIPPMFYKNHVALRKRISGKIARIYRQRIKPA